MKAHRFFPAVLVLLGIHGVLARGHFRRAARNPQTHLAGNPRIGADAERPAVPILVFRRDQEPAAENTVFLCRSDDQGKTFTEPLPMAGPTAAGRAFDPTLWRDPGGRLWYIFNRGNKDTAEHGVYARTSPTPTPRPPRGARSSASATTRLR